MPRSANDSFHLKSDDSSAFSNAPATGQANPFGNASDAESVNNKNDTLNAFNINNDTASFALFKDHGLKTNEISPFQKPIVTPTGLLFLLCSSSVTLPGFGYLIIKSSNNIFRLSSAMRSPIKLYVTRIYLYKEPRSSCRWFFIFQLHCFFIRQVFFLIGSTSFSVMDFPDM